MQTPIQLTTLFVQKLDSRSASSPVWLVLGIIISLVVVIIGLILAAPFLLIVIPLAVIVNYRIAQHQKPKHDGLFIETNWNYDTYYGFIDHKGTRHSHQLIDEYTYWYYTDGATMNGTKCVLVVMLKSKEEEIFLKEELILLHSPEGWGFEDQKISDGPRVWNMRNLWELVNVMNGVGVSEPGSVSEYESAAGQEPYPG